MLQRIRQFNSERITFVVKKVLELDIYINTYTHTIKRTFHPDLTEYIKINPKMSHIPNCKTENYKTSRTHKRKNLCNLGVRQRFLRYLTLKAQLIEEKL